MSEAVGGLDLADFQVRLHATFGAKDARRGAAGTFMYLMEEIGELAEALRDNDRAALEGEFADCLAWLTSLASVSGVDLAAAVAAKYPAGGCLRCATSPCSCGTKP